jgi:hypothetical protein
MSEDWRAGLDVAEDGLPLSRASRAGVAETVRASTGTVLAAVSDRHGAVPRIDRVVGPVVAGFDANPTTGRGVPGAALAGAERPPPRADD